MCSGAPALENLSYRKAGQVFPLGFVRFLRWQSLAHPLFCDAPASARHDHNRRAAV
jgi:hypothetical protein